MAGGLFITTRHERDANLESYSRRIMVPASSSIVLDSKNVEGLGKAIWASCKVLAFHGSLGKSADSPTSRSVCLSGRGPASAPWPLVASGVRRPVLLPAP